MGANRRRAKRLAQKCALVGCDMDFAADERENTDLIERALDAAERQGMERAALAVSGMLYEGIEPSRMPNIIRSLAKEKRAEWDGLCPAKRHGLDWRGQPCDLCAKEKR